MDSLVSALAGLIKVFTEPVQVVLLLVVFGLGFALYKVAMFIADRWDKAVEAQHAMSASLNGLKDIIAEKLDAKH